jgi:hypothetical protein
MGVGNPVRVSNRMKRTGANKYWNCDDVGEFQYNVILAWTNRSTSRNKLPDDSRKV